MKSPTDVEILSFIRDHYYAAFTSFDKDKPSRLTKIYVPIDIDVIAEKFGVDAGKWKILSPAEISPARFEFILSYWFNPIP